MFRNLFWPIALLAALILPPLTSDETKRSQPKTTVATVNYGRIIYLKTKIVPYVQNDQGIMIPSSTLTESEIEKIQSLTKQIQFTIDKLVKEYGFEIVIRQNDDPSTMQVPMAAGNWKPNKNDFLVMTDEERRNKKLRLLSLELENRIVSTGSINITNLVIERLR